MATTDVQCNLIAIFSTKQETFHRFDKDKSGDMNLYELRDALNHLGNNIYWSHDIFHFKDTQERALLLLKKTVKNHFCIIYSPTCPKTAYIISIDPALKCLEEHKLPMTELKTALKSAVEKIMHMARRPIKLQEERISLDVNAL